MKIATKVVCLMLVLLAIIAVDGVLSFRLLTRMGGEVQRVVNSDVVLMQTATAITRCYRGRRRRASQRRCSSRATGACALMP